MSIIKEASTMNTLAYTLLVVVGLFILKAEGQLSFPSEVVLCPDCNISMLIDIGPFTFHFASTSEEELLEYTAMKRGNPCTAFPSLACDDQPATCTEITSPYFYTCNCDEGYATVRYNYRIECEDINECETMCLPPNGSCKNTNGSFECACAEGYTFHIDTCIDINECTSINCSGQGNCMNTEGSFQCKCDTGYKVSPIDPAQCLNIDECTLGACNNITENCVDTQGSYVCNCKAGYESDTFGVCTDINECTMDPCDSNFRCINTMGSYTCTCKDGFVANGTRCENKDECVEEPCDTNAVCEDTQGSFICMCRENYTGDGLTCREIHVCDTGKHSCTERQICVEDGAGFTCMCVTGYQLTGTNCTDINECDTGVHNCHADAECMNNEGSFTCVCKVGYSGDGIECEEIKVCRLENNPCHEYATCTATADSFLCECKQGYSGDGMICNGIDKCSDSAQCGEFEFCKILDGTGDCTCVIGYVKVAETCKLADPLTNELVRHFRRWISRYGPTHEIKWMIENYQKVAPFPDKWMDGLPHFKKLCL